MARERPFQNCKYGELPIHIACFGSCSLQRIQKLLRLNPKSIRVPTETSWLPLHAVVASGHSFETIKFLYEEYPDAIRMRSRGGYLPFHSAVANGHSFETIKFLYEEYPDAIRVPVLSKQGGFPIHILSLSEWSKDPIIQFLVKADPAALKEKEPEKGNLPIHLALKGHTSYETIQLMTDLYENSLKIGNGEGDLPLYVALNNGHCAKTVEWLVQKTPHSCVKQLRLVLCLFPNRINNDINFSILCLLARDFPFLAENDLGRYGELGLLLHIVCRNVASESPSSQWKDALQ
ncbi:proteasome regulatory particle subunit [Seminavis robusta]|uniref:Proteasome regulatory particle subunit n=1 Tax=Seminavis robusta TaxID=568900 RepID=A0A9N8DRW9_9STRA|nr:proteasome regulatory particle subunit [Seminavis robusta]|eukprot:Sro309_g113720.1 proteasome regulatory particle subunit (291) ;mRNA; f:17123-17995